MNLTTEQTAIVTAPVTDLLISAAAGSGKTAVMTERIVQRIVSADLEIDQVLVMTFTEAAARQMKAKIAAKLDQALLTAADPTLRRRLIRQQTLLPGSAVSTVHAFCLTVVRNFCQLAADEQGRLLVEPGFAVLDPQVADLLLREAIDETLAACYESIDQMNHGQTALVHAHDQTALVQDGTAISHGVTRPDGWWDAFYRLVDSFSTSRSDEPLRLEMQQFYQYLRSLPDYRDQVDRYRAEISAAAADFSGSEHARVLQRQLRIVLNRAVAVLPEIQSWLDSGVVLAKAADRNQIFQVEYRRMVRVLSELDAILTDHEPVDWDALVRLANQLADLDLPDLRGKNHSEGKVALISLFRQHLAECIHCLTGQFGTQTYQHYFRLQTRWLFDRPAAAIEAEIADMQPVLNVLFDLVLDADAAYREKKRAQSAIDFGDFEHLALQILRQPEAACYYQNRYREIYIDEYQDTSSIQDALLQAIGRNNVFMVGDVKQSIYRFRHARPSLFIDRANRYRAAQSCSLTDLPGSDQPADPGRLMTLNRNFRSVPGILNAVNDMFRQLMTVAAGEIDYDDSQALTAHRVSNAAAPAVQLLLIDLNGPAQTDGGDRDDAGLDSQTERADDPEAGSEAGQPARLTADSSDQSGADLTPEDLSRYEAEALVVRQNIAKRLADGVQPGDIVILARTRAIVRTFAAKLIEWQIPVLEDTGQAWLDNPELRLIHALLQVMDNPLQDIPLAAVMRSSLCEGGFSAAQLWDIRIQASRLSTGSNFFHEAVTWYAQHGPEGALKDQVNRFFDWLSTWRVREKHMKVGEWLIRLLTDSQFDHQVAASPDGAAKTAQVQAFIRWIETFERHRRRGLFDLVRHLEKMILSGVTESPFAVETSEQNAVRVMTIHRSKGLEFPVVFVVGLTANLSPKEIQAAIVISETLGIGFDWIDPQIHSKFPTHLKLAMLEEQRSAALAEEMRLLYVAMTRAKDQLIMASALPARGRPALIERLTVARAVSGCVLPPDLVLSCRSYLEWILLALSRHPDLDWSALAPDLGAPGPGTGDSCQAGLARGVWSLEIRSVQDFLSWTDDPADTLPHEPDASGLTDTRLSSALNHPAPLDPATQLAAWFAPLESGQAAALEPLIESSLRRIDPSYRFEAAARLPVKLSVSELKRAEQQESQLGDEQTLPMARPMPGIGARGINLDLRPILARDPTEVRPTGAALGTLLHRFVRYLDWPALRQGQSVEAQLADRLAGGLFSHEEALAIEPSLPAITEFAASDLASRMVEAEVSRSQLYREMPFTLSLPAMQIWPAEQTLAPDDRVLVQGIIDCWFVESGAAILIDYKTDRVTGSPGQIRSILAGRYHRQLDYYAQAIEAATHLPVQERIIVHLPSRQVWSGDAAAWSRWAQAGSCDADLVPMDTQESRP